MKIQMTDSGAASCVHELENRRLRLEILKMSIHLNKLSELLVGLGCYLPKAIEFERCRSYWRIKRDVRYDTFEIILALKKHRHENKRIDTLLKSMGA